MYIFAGYSVLANSSLMRPFYIFERRLDSNPESCRSMQARYQLSHPSNDTGTYLATHLSNLATHLPNKPYLIKINLIYLVLQSDYSKC